MPASVHPRVCGEHLSSHATRRSCPGSSPRMRGTSPVRQLRRQGHAVHPRVCGEHCGRGAMLPTVDGSSPRMRGTYLSTHVCRRPGRFIPAYAGNMPPIDISTTKGSVHPRVCGEHDTSTGRVVDSAGSSPRMRGTLNAACAIADHCRFIPAYAGNMLKMARRTSRLPVHPRVCGEHSAMTGLLGLLAGSSPRMRGTWNPRCQFGKSRRFIPAYAGNMNWQGNIGFPWTVHPRVCGEHIYPFPLSSIFIGSSPRMRGTLFNR